ncbi:hypothetical protein ACYCS5_10350 [Paenibacillus sp. SEL3]|nr:hypothetical protein [Paenibacillus polymyxa]
MNKHTKVESRGQFMLAMRAFLQKALRRPLRLSSTFRLFRSNVNSLKEVL